jgi:hypothetical protein
LYRWCEKDCRIGSRSKCSRCRFFLQHCNLMLWRHNLWVFATFLKVRKFQNKNIKSSHCPKYEQKKLKNYPLIIQDRIVRSYFLSFGSNSLILEPIMHCKLHNWFSLSLTFSGPFDFPAIWQRPKMLLPSFLLSLSCILSPILVNCEKWSPLLHHHHHQLEDLTAQESRLGWTNE